MSTKIISSGLDTNVRWVILVLTALVVASGLALGLGLTREAQAIGPNAVRAGFNDNVLPRNDDGSTQNVSMGLSHPLNFFGQQYSNAYVNNNGNITFDAPLGTYTPFPLSNTQTKIIAPFFSDVDTRAAGSQPVTYSYGASSVDGHDAFGVNWVNVGYYNSHADKLNNFQLVLIDRSDIAPGDFDIEFNYDRIQWETGDASGGFRGLGGDSARVGYSNGTTDPGSSYELPGSAVNGAFLDTNTQNGLIHDSLNSPQPGRYVFAVRNGVVQPPQEDSTPPTINPVVVGTLGNNGWYTSDVDVSWDVTDGESDISDTTGCGPITINTDTASQTLTCSATSAGGTSEQSVTIKRDATPPMLNPSVSPNPVLLDESATVTPNANDATSGVDPASVSCGAVDTSSVGSKSVNCSATDNAGNANSASASYSVIYDWRGFFAPVDNPETGRMNSLKAGSAIPLKFSLDGDPVANSDTGFGTEVLTSQGSGALINTTRINCATGTLLDPIPTTELVSAGSSSLSYDPVADHYNLVWKTDKGWAQTCRQAVLVTNDDVPHKANFYFTR